MSDSSPVLVLRALGLGDTLTAVPALRGLRRLDRRREIVLACAHPAALLLREHGVVDAIIPAVGLAGPPPGRVLGRHDAVNLHGCGPQSHRLLVAGEPDQVLAFDCPPAGVRGPSWDGNEHEVRRWCRLVDSAGARCDPSDLVLDRRDVGSVRTGPVVLHAGAASGSRCWPVDRWIRVARRLAGRGHPLVLTGTGDVETDRAATICREAGLAPGCNLTGRLDLTALTALVRSARAVLCTDTGVAHLATACGTSSVVLYGPTPPRLWGPLAQPERHVVLWHGATAAAGREWRGDPHARRADPMLCRIGPGEVVTASLRLLEPGTR